ncbi:hypothetical protein AVEN_29723-1 [Araneus ventricosus]|uniref:Uncharacterized protein n=1 Tax=Araneus ventricosus TaxID=182803 RepID=A0A4Y2NZA2_ARAVE|nr:hypothetical protein AVEN_29723-1 [Araneus ventricosus]
MTRSQRHKQDPPKSQEEKKDPQNSVSRDAPAVIVRGELLPFELPPAEREAKALLKVGSCELGKAQRDCPTLQTCFGQERKGSGDLQIIDGRLFSKSKDHLGNVIYQLFLPRLYRDKILALCQKGISSHLGVRETKY